VNWIAIPLASLTVLSTLAGGIVALRLHRELTTLIALTGGIVIGVALFEVLPEAIDAVDTAARVTGLVGLGILIFFRYPLTEQTFATMVAETQARRADMSTR
jgi:hypothetical protein